MHADRSYILWSADSLLPYCLSGSSVIGWTHGSTPSLWTSGSIWQPLSWVLSASMWLLTISPSSWRKGCWKTASTLRTRALSNVRSYRRTSTAWISPWGTTTRASSAGGGWTSSIRSVALGLWARQVLVRPSPSSSRSSVSTARKALPWWCTTTSFPPLRRNYTTTTKSTRRQATFLTDASSISSTSSM